MWCSSYIVYTACKSHALCLSELPVVSQMTTTGAKPKDMQTGQELLREHTRNASGTSAIASLLCHNCKWASRYVSRSYVHLTGYHSDHPRHRLACKRISTITLCLARAARCTMLQTQRMLLMLWQASARLWTI